MQLHMADDRFTSFSETETPDGVVRRDYQRAHAAASDPGLTQSLPETCWQCYVKAIAEAEAQKAARLDG